MEIQNGSLVVEVEGATMTVPLPEVVATAQVKAYLVPEGYRPGRLFVSVTEPGQPEEIPACDQSLVELLGEATLEPADSAVLEAARAAKRIEINTACDAAVAKLAASYPEREIQSWPQQVKEAEALAGDADAPAPLLAAIADTRGLPVSELAERVLTKMAAYAQASGALIGLRQALEDALDDAETLEAIAAITFEAQTQ